MYTEVLRKHGLLLTASAFSPASQCSHSTRLMTPGDTMSTSLLHHRGFVQGLCIASCQGCRLPFKRDGPVLCLNQEGFLSLTASCITNCPDTVCCYLPGGLSFGPSCPDTSQLVSIVLFSSQWLRCPNGTGNVLLDLSKITMRSKLTVQSKCALPSYWRLLTHLLIVTVQVLLWNVIWNMFKNLWFYSTFPCGGH